MPATTAISRVYLCIAFVTTLFSAAAAQNIFSRLPAGNYAVGFSIFTFTDSSRMAKPETDYLGQKVTGDRYRKITVHLWYPAQKGQAKQQLTYSNYCYSYLQTSTAILPDTAAINRELAAARQSVERWFGATTNDNWQKLLQSTMLASADAAHAQGRFPVLVGMLRPLSTAIVNEVLASNGYVVAMVLDDNSVTFADGALEQVPDLRLTINYLSKTSYADVNSLGCYSFSGSGFIPMLFGMYDFRVKALADIESGIYMDGLYQAFSASNYYKPHLLKAPFLHLFSRDLAKQEKYISDFEDKTLHSTRYRLLLNQPNMHHWDNASEGYTACLFLHNRGDKEEGTKQCFEIGNTYMLNFFNAVLKDDTQAKAFLAAKPAITGMPPAMWDINVLPAIQPAPSLTEFEQIVREKGIDYAINIVNNTIARDSITSLRTGFRLNRLGYVFFAEKKYVEAIAIFKLNTQLHNDDPNFFDSLAEGYEAVGDNDNMKKAAAQVLQLFAQKATLTDGEKTIKTVNEKRVAK